VFGFGGVEMTKGIFEMIGKFLVISFWILMKMK